ncbi:MAG: hypothetical protein ABII90_02865 [Bacteroidota bacterium]
MKNYKVNINRPKVTPGEIANRRDFSKVFKSYTKLTQPFFKKPWFFSSAAVTVVVAVSVIIYVQFVQNKDETPAADQSYVYEPGERSLPGLVPFVDSPFQGVDIEFEKYSVNTEKGAELDHPTGSKIKIPQNAFADEKGELVEGVVELRYRELHDPVDFFVSGIPMTYDSAGNQYHFESAGMIEILAFKDSKPVFMNPGKEIEIKMASYYDGTQYNLYQLDTANGNWAFKGKDNVIRQDVTDEATEAGSVFEDEIDRDTELTPEGEITGVLSEEIKTIKKQIAKIEKQKPLKPKKLNKQRYSFNIAVDPKEFPEITVYKDMQFEIGEENKNFKPELYNILWEDATITENKKGISYNLTLTKGKDSHTFVVYPVFEGKDYDEAMQVYEQNFQQYRDKLEKRKAEEKRKQEEYEAQIKKLEQEQIARQKAWEEQKRKAFLAVSTRQKVFRAFTINGFGVWNCDKPINFPKGNIITAEFQDEQENALNLDRVYLVEKNRNAMFTYYSNQYVQFRYNPKVKNMLWGVTPDNELAVFDYNAFSAVPGKRGPYTFKMKLIDREFETVEEVKEILNI